MLMQSGNWWTLVLYVAGSVLAGIALTFIGYQLTK